MASERSAPCTFSSIASEGVHSGSVSAYSLEEPGENISGNNRAVVFCPSPCLDW